METEEEECFLGCEVLGTGLSLVPRLSALLINCGGGKGERSEPGYEASTGLCLILHTEKKLYLLDSEANINNHIKIFEH